MRYLTSSSRMTFLTAHSSSLDIYIQNTSPGADKESNWLPAPQDGFNLVLRMYLPQPQVLNGTWQSPLVQPAAG